MKPVRVLCRTSIVSDSEGLPKSNFGDCIRILLAELDVRYHYIYLLDQPSYDLLTILYDNLSFEVFGSHYYNSSFEYFVFSDCRYNDLLSSEIYNATKTLDLFNPYTFDSSNLASWQQTFSRQLGFPCPNTSYPPANKSFNSSPSEMTKIGINYLVPTNWSSKSPSLEWITALSDYMSLNNYFPSLQPPITSLHDYVEWISSCSIFLTVEGLGLHIAQACDIPTILLSGPLPNREHLHDKLFVLSDDSYSCKPCYSGTCYHEGVHCLDAIPFVSIIELINQIQSK